ncbi:MAG TPA: nuclear transport factor 2 family protein [Dehalococcoidia bacterium]|nr:nuclear transport factor 2 family protein [Dehalococcoidia bacterium]
MTLSLEDRLDILDLAARYSHASDHGDGRALADTFTEDGIFEGAGEPRRGRAAHEAATNALAASGLVLRHFVSNPVIEGDGDRATMRLYVEVKNLADPTTPMLVGCYYDELQRIDGRWKFARRRVETDYPQA